MSSRKHVLAGVAALGFMAALNPSPACAASFLAAAGPMQADPISASNGRLERIVFRAHSRRSTSYYCYPRSYWWFYRPYNTAQAGYARCMPYFHYPPGRRGRAGPRGMK